MRHIPAVGTAVKVRYIPMPYLGTGILEPVEVEGNVHGTRTFKGVTYLILTDAEGKCVLERNINDIEVIEETGTAPVTRARLTPETHHHSERKSNYNRV